MKRNLLPLFALFVAMVVSTLTACNKSTGPSGTDSATISVSPGSVKANGIETATLSWFTRAGSCRASGDWGGSKDSGGSQVVGPFSADGTKSYALTCDGAVGTAVLLVGAGPGGADTVTSSDGLVTVTIVQRTPTTGPLVAGQPLKLKVHVANRSDGSVFLLFDIFVFGSTFEAHSESDWTANGSTSRSLSGSVPIIYLKGSYNKGGWTMEFVGWP